MDFEVRVQTRPIAPPTKQQGELHEHGNCRTQAAGHDHQLAGGGMSAGALIEAAPVVRDSVGEWIHPALPEFDEGDSEKWRAWLAENGLEIKRYMLEDEPDDHPVYVSYFEDGEGNFSDWHGAMPAGEGWFTLAVYDTEDGPTWCWARKLAVA